MTVLSSSNTQIYWDETGIGKWKWLTFGALQEIVDAAKKAGVGNDTFVTFHPEYAEEDVYVKADRVMIKDTKGLS